MVKKADKPPKPEFYRRLEVLCAQNGLSPAGLAEKVGLSNSTAASWGRGVIPNGDTVVLMARELKTTTDYILTGECPPSSLDKTSAAKPDSQYAMDKMAEMATEMTKEHCQTAAEMTKEHCQTMQKFVDIMAIAQKENTAAIVRVADQLSLFENPAIKKTYEKV
jgi:transcriptional regulator with XRE-family HTH domain